MRRFCLFGAALLASMAVAQSSAPTLNSGMPDPAREYFQRSNCHNAYDYAQSVINRGGNSGAEYKAWALAHEQAAEAGTPCREPSAALRRLAANRSISTSDGAVAAKLFADKQKDAAALMELGVGHLTSSIVGGTTQQGLALIRQAADLGDPAATFTVATLWASGMIDNTKNHAQAFKLFQQAARAGHVDAIYRMGIYLQEGVATRQDPRQAFAAYQRAAESGHLYATIMAFSLINDGKVRQDWMLAARLGRNVARAGEAYGMVIVVSSLLQSSKPFDHQDEILYWLGQAHANGNQQIRSMAEQITPQVVSLFKRRNARPTYSPPARKACPMKTVCTVNHYSGLQSCTTNKDYWSDCDF